MDAILFCLAAITLALLVAVGIEAGLGNRSIGFLKDMVPSEKALTPRVSVLIPARNEVRKIEEGLASVLSQDYPNLEIIVLDDRADDGTGDILSRMKSRHPGLKVLRISELPAGWIGKNYALSCGTGRATGDLLLFTDADVVMNTSTVRKAVGYLLENRLDHLTLTPDIRIPASHSQSWWVCLAFCLACLSNPGRSRIPEAVGSWESGRSIWYKKRLIRRWEPIRPSPRVRTMAWN
jgi:cellulose synthase/poly-beta-1,6-N-acetylglucosamine synthase-like glycosyltransferase